MIDESIDAKSTSLIIDEMSAWLVNRLYLPVLVII